jgi:hypothetical protein
MQKMLPKQSTESLNMYKTHTHTHTATNSNVSYMICKFLHEVMFHIYLSSHNVQKTGSANPTGPFHSKIS